MVILRSLLPCLALGACVAARGPVTTGPAVREITGAPTYGYVVEAGTGAEGWGRLDRTADTVAVRAPKGDKAGAVSVLAAYCAPRGVTIAPPETWADEVVYYNEETGEYWFPDSCAGLPPVNG